MSQFDLYYEQTGSGPDITLIHGVGSRSEDWIDAARILATRFRVLRFDLRGHGQSSAPGGIWRIEDFSEDLVRLLDRLGLEQTHLAGFSLGGLIAQRFALDHPDRLNRLSLICATTGRNKEQKTRAIERFNKLQTLDPEDYVRQSIERWFTPEFIAERPDIIEKKRKTILGLDRQAYARAYRVLIDTNHADELHQIAAPTLIIAAENDIGSPPAMSERMHRDIPDSRLIVLPRLRHSILLECPEIVGGLLREFFVDNGSSAGL